jgi:HD-GYP domain-containing protein (c-di-GMP phosphodiesterase class II)
MFYLLLAVFALVALAPLSSVAWKLIDRNREDLKTSEEGYQLLLASTVSRELDIHVAALREQLVRGTRPLALEAARAGRLEDDVVRRVLDDMVDRRMQYVRFTDLRGRIVESQSANPIPRSLEPVFLAGFRDAAESLAEYRETGGEATALGDPLLIPGTPRRAVFVLAAPVVSGGRVLGVASALVDFQAVWDAVIADNTKTGRALFVVDAKGHLLAVTKLPGVEVGRDMADSQIVRRFRDHSGRAAETMPFDWAPGRAAPVEHYLGSYGLTSEGWGVFVQARERDVYKAISKMIESAAQWGMIALVGALFAATVFAVLLARPIKRLDEATRAFTQGDYSTRVQVRSITEVGDLEHTFNLMAENLEDKIRRLKEAVAENKELFRGTAEALTSAIDAKDPYTRGHSARVNHYAKVLARHYGCSDEDFDVIDVASLLHDVGKIGVDDAILNKQGDLTDPEFEVMKKHTVIGERIMTPIRQMARMLPGLRSHHERWAGQGYPDRLKGEEIPLIARIIAVADAFDAMTTDRPYQKAMSFESAVARLNHLKGSHFDERMVEAFTRAYNRGEITPQALPVAPQPVAEPSVA